MKISPINQVIFDSNSKIQKFNVNFESLKGLKLKHELYKSKDGEILTDFISSKGVFRGLFRNCNAKISISSTKCDRNTIHNALLNAGKFELIFNPYNENTYTESYPYPPKEHFDRFNYGTKVNCRCSYRDKGFVNLFKKPNFVDFEEFSPEWRSNRAGTAAMVTVMNFARKIEDAFAERKENINKELRAYRIKNNIKPYKTIEVEHGQKKDKITFYNKKDYRKYKKLIRKREKIRNIMNKIFENRIQGTWAFALGHMSSGISDFHSLRSRCSDIESDIKDLINKGNFIFAD